MALAGASAVRGAWILLLSGCGDSHPGHPRLYSASEVRVEACGAEQRDVLFVVDDGVSMSEESGGVSGRISDLVRDLLYAPDWDGDGSPDWREWWNFHVGVVTSTGDGALWTGPSIAEAPCEDRYPLYLEWDAEWPDPAVPDEVDCLARFDGAVDLPSRPFEVARAALGDLALPGGPNEGFVREDSLLAIYLVTDRDDESGADPAEMADAVLSLRPDHPDRIVLGAVAGVPPDLVALSERQLVSDDPQTTEDFDRVLADPSMQADVACESPAFAQAVPSPRIVETIREVDRQGNSGMVQSVCQDDWTPLDRLLTRLISADGYDPCLHRPLVGDDGVPLANGEHTSCMVRATRIDASPCGPGTIEIGRDDGHTLCHVCQRGDGEPGWETDAEGHDLSACLGTSWDWFYSTEIAGCGGSGKVELEGEGACDGLSGIERLSLACLREWDVP